MSLFRAGANLNGRDFWFFDEVPMSLFRAGAAAKETSSSR